MKINIRTALVLSVFAVVLTLASSSFAQPVVGGYRAVANDDKGVVAASQFANDAQSKISKTEIAILAIVKAERQIVAGSNYRLCVRFNESGENTRYAQTVVYVDLQNKYKLTSWDESKCGEAADPVGMNGFKPDRNYKPVDNGDGGAGLAADFAVGAQAKKTKSVITPATIIKAEDLEPALGYRNFRLCLKTTVDGKATTAQTLVNVGQYSNYKLVSWTEMKCGGDGGHGYSPVEKTHPGAGLAADFAVQEESKVLKTPVKLVSIVKAEMQDGARLGAANFRLCLIASGGSVGPGSLAIVSMDQYSNLKLVSWTASKCVETDGDYEPVEKGFTAGVDMAADWAVAQHSKETGIPHKLIEILKGEEKGMFSLTYRICMTVGEEGKTQTIQAIVTRDQYSNHKLVSWEHSTCGK